MSREVFSRNLERVREDEAVKTAKFEFGPSAAEAAWIPKHLSARLKPCPDEKQGCVRAHRRNPRVGQPRRGYCLNVAEGFQPRFGERAGRWGASRAFLQGLKPPVGSIGYVGAEAPTS